ncbi:malto-oligosyltrehalose trehalohydrolase [Devosia rhizoryzae]|uniref:Malto-oligosyltrehalose trehalohydrolase n=1 Tax=Devosia rhizoryzae TaxID=2774137 RepID=A0ABX7C9Q3_9HYPH|nr:malto-oligosyltrehalose trehalohydrolase [Devosia rhizoryzae]QQR40958.1 malto-oligosyltrehalose trehalohydrolase [Devosia rhizoryzae]
MTSRRHLGAIPDANGTQFTVWAEGRKSVVVEVEGQGAFPLEASEDGYFSAHAEGVKEGARYKIRVDDGAAVPDLASRWQPDGNDGASVVVSGDFDWTDGAWTGPTTRDQVVYELHIGTFTQEGTWKAAREKLAFLAELGVTVIQIMPIGTFKGAFGWGYDTTLPYAPFAPYGSPQDIRAFVDAAHGLGVGVILDVVYNHVGLGDHFRAYSEHYFTDRYENEWGASFNYDGEHSRAVRDFVLGNAVYWITEFHMDGLRIDAAQAMFDSSEEHIIAELSRAVREAAAPRSAYIIVENQPQEHRMIDPLEQGGYNLDGMYNDDFQHAIRVAATGHNDFYYRDYLGTPQEIVSSLKYGFLYHGQRSDQRDAAYGTDNLDTPPEHFIHFLENHDQVANSPQGLRLTSLLSPARLRAVTALLLLGPQTPCLFQGQEFGSSNPFLYFFGIDGEAADLVSNGRKESLKNFPGVADPAMLERLADPTDRKTFERSKLDWVQADQNTGLLKLHQDLLSLRKSEPTFSQNSDRRIDGAVLGDGALLLRYLTPDPAGHRVLLLNLGRDLHMSVVAEPLIAPPGGHKWVPAWSSEHPDYNGAGRRPVEPEKFWILPSDCAVLLRSEPR